MLNADEYIKSRLDDVLRGQRRLEEKIDSMRDEQIAQREHIASHRATIADHERLLLHGNGQKPLMVRMAEVTSDVRDIKSDIKELKIDGKFFQDPAIVKREKLVNHGKTIAVIGVVISQILTWFFGWFPFN